MKRYLKQKSIDTRYCQFSLIFPCWWEIDHKYVKILRNTKNNLERVHMFFSYYTVYTVVGPERNNNDKYHQTHATSTVSPASLTQTTRGEGLGAREPGQREGGLPQEGGHTVRKKLNVAGNLDTT